MATHTSHPDVTVQHIREDCEVASKKYHYAEFCFTWATVRFLLDVIEELSQSEETEVSDAQVG